MSDKEFWRCTPRRLFALYNVHAEVNAPKDETGKPVIPDDEAWPSPDDPRLTAIDKI